VLFGKDGGLGLGLGFEGRGRGKWLRGRGLDGLVDGFGRSGVGDLFACNEWYVLEVRWRSAGSRREDRCHGFWIRTFV
jgi:hypothetical protein